MRIAPERHARVGDGGQEGGVEKTIGPAFTKCERK